MKNTLKSAATFVISPELNRLKNAVNAANGKCIAVGGCVRDHLLGISPKDVDIEVYGLTIETLEKTLQQLGSVHAVGKSFGVLKLIMTGKNGHVTFDVSLPRTENKQGQGHKGFLVTPDANLSFTKASSRRDFTINAMGIDLHDLSLIDSHNGTLDLQNKVLRHVSSAFSEDPLRVLRACQMAARFKLIIDSKTIAECLKLKNELTTLPEERIWEEFKKLLLAAKPSLGLQALHDTGSLSLFPELEVLQNCPQEPKWHPEGDVWVHTLMVVDEAAKIIRREQLDEETALIIMLGSLCHDLGKPSTTKIEDGRIRSKNHEGAGEKPTVAFLNRIGASKDMIAEVVPLVKEHLKPCQLYNMRESVSDSAIKRLANRANIEKLCLVAEADYLGRTTEDALTGLDPSSVWLLNKAKELAVSKAGPQSIIMGRNLLDLGIKAGPKMGKILHAAYEAQLDDLFTDLDGGIVWLKKNGYI